MSYVDPQHHASFLSSLENTFDMDDVVGIGVVTTEFDKDDWETQIVITLKGKFPLADEFTEEL